MGASIYNGENGSEYYTPVKEQDYKSYLKKFLTKQMCKILLILFYHTLSNKELAKRMGITANALSNIIQRMKTSQVELFIISKKDKFTLYSLTHEAQVYVKEYLIVEENSEQKIIQFSDDETSAYIECADALHKLKHNLQIDSEIEFSRFMELYYVKESEEKRTVLDDFIRHLVKMDYKKQTEAFNKIIKEMENPLLGRNILHCVSLYQSMINLCKVYSTTWKLSYKFVNSCLDSKGVSFEFLEECKDFNAEEIVAMGQGLSEIVNISKMNNHSMNEFIECWEAYFSEEQFLYFIASRYDSWMTN